MLFRARLGTFLTFALGGLLCGVWTSRLPGLSDKLGLDAGSLGIVVLCWGLGALVAMQGLRGVIARAGSRTVLRVAMPLAAATAALVAVAPTYGTLLVAVAGFGMAFGVMDIAMNAQGSVVERAHDKPIMNGMHAGWSVGAMAGGLTGFGTAAAGFSFTVALFGTAVLALPLALALGRTFLPDPVEPAAGDGAAARRLPAAVYLIGALAFIAFMVEGSIADWSGLLLHGELGTTEAIAALGYPLFQVGMLLGRLGGDRLRTRIGTRLLLIGSGIGTAAAMIVVLTAPTAPVAMAGLALSGAMVCTSVPVLVSLAGTVAPGRSAASVAQVGAMGYGGLLLGPVLIGFLADATSLRIGLLVVVALALAGAAGARRLPMNAATDVAAADVRPVRPAAELVAA